jgi:chaperonin GroEL
MKKGIDIAVTTLKQELKKISIPVEDKNQIKNIATISANGDEQIGALLSDLIDKVGKSGVITIGQSKTLKHEI